MKCLTLTQPWATLVAIGAKSIETRSWRTRYTGPLAIHAAKGFPKTAHALVRMPIFNVPLVAAGFDGWESLPTAAVIATCYLKYCVPIPADLNNPGCEADLFTCCVCGHIKESHRHSVPDAMSRLNKECNHKGICRAATHWDYYCPDPIGTGIDRQIASCACPKYRRWFTRAEQLRGDYTAGRYAWLLSNVKKLDQPIAARGALSLWDWDPDSAIARTQEVSHV